MTTTDNVWIKIQDQVEQAERQKKEARVAETERKILAGKWVTLEQWSELRHERNCRTLSDAFERKISFLCQIRLRLRAEFRP